MSTIVILGAGPLGGSIAHALAARTRVREIRLIDDRADVAAGKALDIRQAGPVERFDTRLDGSGDVLAAASATVVVVADRVDSGEWQGEDGLGLVRRLLRAGVDAPLVFAGAAQTWLIEKSHRELGVPGARLVGTAASALVASARALVGLELDRSPVDVGVSVIGRPGGFVVAWSAATAAGSLVTERVPPHRLLSISDDLGRLWPPGPRAIAAATAPVLEALASGSRRRHHAMTILDGELGAKGVAAMLPLDLGRGRVLGRVVPSLSPLERTQVQRAVGS